MQEKNAPHEYYKSLAKKRMAAGVLFLNQQGEILLVNPVYKDRWEIPGGVVEQNESPKAAAEREVKEELGLDVALAELLCVDYVADHEERGDNLQFIFFGGELSAEQINSIRLQQGELKEFRFFDPEKFESGKLEIKIGDKLRFRIARALEALKNQKMVYIENPFK